MRLVIKIAPFLFQVVEMLLEKGADPSRRTTGGLNCKRSCLQKKSHFMDLLTY